MMKLTWRDMAGVLVETSEFAADLRRRVREARQALDVAKAEGDFYALDIRAGELDSLLRIAMENNITLDADHDATGPDGDR